MNSNQTSKSRPKIVHATLHISVYVATPVCSSECNYYKPTIRNIIAISWNYITDYTGSVITGVIIVAGKRVADEMQAEKPDALNKPSVKSAAVSIEQLCAFDQDPARQCTNVASKHVLRLRIANVTGRLSRAEYLAAREQLQAEDLISARHFKITRYVLLAIVASVALIGVWPLFG